MRITVVVPDEANEKSALQLGIARAKDFAQEFARLAHKGSAGDWPGDD
jgi:hypothetical protein